MGARFSRHGMLCTLTFCHVPGDVIGPLVSDDPHVRAHLYERDMLKPGGYIASDTEYEPFRSVAGHRTGPLDAPA